MKAIHSPQHTGHAQFRKNLPWMVAGGGCAAVTLAAVYLPLGNLMAVIGLLVCVLLGLAVANRMETRHEPPLATWLEVPFALAHHPKVFERYRQFSQLLIGVCQHHDYLYQEIAQEQLDQIIGRTAEISSGTLVFQGTEVWRIVYERLLRSFGLHQYRSVAWIKNAQYWQDEPGRKSMAVNYELVEDERLIIERIAIIADALWPAGTFWPEGLVHHWLREQHARGINVRFVRESVLKNEPELIADIGIYGTRALGTQELDDQCRTVRFTLTFDYDQMQAAEDRWHRLSVYAESFESSADRYESAT